MALGCLLFIGVQKRNSGEKSLESASLLVLSLMIGIMYSPGSLTVSTIAVVFLSALLIICLKREL